MSNTKLPALPPHPAIRDGITWRDDERKAIDEYARAAILADRERQAGEAVAFEFYNPATGHAIVDYSQQTHVGPLTKEMGYEARPLGYVTPPPAAVKPGDLVPLWQAREALDSLEESARGDAPYNHFAASLVRTALEQAALYSLPAPQAVQAGRMAQMEALLIRAQVCLDTLPNYPEGADICDEIDAVLAADVSENKSLHDDAPRWVNVETTMEDPLFQQARAIMGTNTWFQDNALRNVINYVLAASPSPDGKAEQAEAPSDYPQFLLRKCEHCGCKTNAKMRACCKAGWVDDKVASEDRASLAPQPTASNAGERALLKDIGLLLHHFWCDVQMNDYSFQKLNAMMMRIDAALATNPPAGEQKPFAWATFDGEGSYDLRLFEDNEDYRDQFIKRNGPQFTSWVLPLYLGAQPEQVAQDREHAENYRLIRRGQHWSVVDGIGNTLRGEDLDAAVDAIRAARARGDGGAS